MNWHTSFLTSFPTRRCLARKIILAQNACIVKLSSSRLKLAELKKKWDFTTSARARTVLTDGPNKCFWRFSNLCDFEKFNKNSSQAMEVICRSNNPFKHPVLQLHQNSILNKELFCFVALQLSSNIWPSLFIWFVLLIQKKNLHSILLNINCEMWEKRVGKPRQRKFLTRELLFFIPYRQQICKCPNGLNWPF